MSVAPKFDPKMIRSFILYEFLQKRKINEGFHNLCKIVSNDVIGFDEFQFWFTRFSEGKQDLDFQINNETFGQTDTHTEKEEEEEEEMSLGVCSDPKPDSLTDLPSDVFNKIGENLKLKDRLHLRNVCKNIRYQVDSWDLKVDEIYYRNGKDWKVWETYGSGPYWADNFGRIENNSFWCGSYRDPILFVMSVLKLPKLQVEKLTIRSKDEYWKKLIKRLDDSNRKLRVKKVEFKSNGGSSKIDLHFMIPGVLEEIKMFLLNPKREEIFEIVKSEQCQAAKMVYIDSPTVISKFPLEALYNCPRFTLTLGGRPADGLKSNFLKTLMEYGKVQECVIYAQRKIMKYFNEPEAMVPNFPSLRRYPIPGTSEYYELEYREEFGEQFVRLQRKQ